MPTRSSMPASRWRHDGLVHAGRNHRHRAQPEGGDGRSAAVRHRRGFGVCAQAFPGNRCSMRWCTCHHAAAGGRRLSRWSGWGTTARRDASCDMFGISFAFRWCGRCACQRDHGFRRWCVRSACRSSGRPPNRRVHAGANRLRVFLTITLPLATRASSPARCRVRQGAGRAGATITFVSNIPETQTLSSVHGLMQCPAASGSGGWRPSRWRSRCWPCWRANGGASPVARRWIDARHAIS